MFSIIFIVLLYSSLSISNIEPYCLASIYFFIRYSIFSFSVVFGINGIISSNSFVSVISIMFGVSFFSNIVLLFCLAFIINAKFANCDALLSMSIPYKLFFNINSDISDVVYPFSEYISKNRSNAYTNMCPDPQAGSSSFIFSNSTF